MRNARGEMSSTPAAFVLIAAMYLATMLAVTGRNELNCVTYEVDNVEASGATLIGAGGMFKFATIPVK